MPEPTTRDEHVAKAAELLRWAGLAYDGEGAKGHVTRADFDSDAAYWEAVRIANEAYDLTLAEVNALANWAQAHIKIAEVLGQQPAAESAWVHQTGWLFEHRDGGWELRYAYPSEIDARHPRVGWYLEGPGMPLPKWMADEDAAEAMRHADEEIARRKKATS